MSIIHPGLFILMKRFPSKKDLLRRLYLKDRSFHTLCDDYQRCVKAIAHWTKSGHDQALERSRDYQTLLQDLESEIKERIGEKQ